TDRRHPRTAVGTLADGRIVLFVVDGRSPYHSLGMTLLELAMELRRLGAVDALNLDGGGSTTMVVHGRVINLPSDENGERPVGSVLLVLPP
ncbi:MAG TPA: phosphodiester glycosidase family protein, partial [bacterium]